MGEPAVYVEVLERFVREQEVGNYGLATCGKFFITTTNEIDRLSALSELTGEIKGRKVVIDALRQFVTENGGFKWDR